MCFCYAVLFVSLSRRKCQGNKEKDEKKGRLSVSEDWIVYNKCDLLSDNVALKSPIITIMAFSCLVHNARCTLGG